MTDRDKQINNVLDGWMLFASDLEPETTMGAEMLEALRTETEKLLSTPSPTSAVGQDAEELVDKIVDDLMTNAFGQRAVRLQLRLAGEIDGGGYSESSIRVIVQLNLQSAIDAAKAEERERCAERAVAYMTDLWDGWTAEQLRDAIRGIDP